MTDMSSADRSDSGGHDNPSGPTDGPDALAALEWRLHRTYKARMETARRQQARGNNWNVALVLASLSTVTVSVVTLAAKDVYGEQSEALMVVLGAATLVVSVLVTSAQFQVQAEKFFNAYRNLQKLWVEADREAKSLTNAQERNAASARIDASYQDILDDTANHIPADFYKGFPGVVKPTALDPNSDRGGLVSRPEFIRRKCVVAFSELFTILPLLIGTSMMLLLIPAVRWFLGA